MPTQGWARPPPSNNRPGVLGSRPQQQAYQAYTAPMEPSLNGQSGSSVPTDIASAMHTMTLNPPDPSWYMDTGATSHMTSSNGNLSSYFHLKILVLLSEMVIQFLSVVMVKLFYLLLILLYP